MILYKTVLETEASEIEVKKSKFIAEIRHIETEEEALSLLKEFKKRYYDATHNCSAFVLRADNGLRHSSDDGEPSGTAGKPMLDVLAGEGLFDVLVVVTRYFGGTLLGTGGLVRAYQGAVKAVLEKAKIMEVHEGELLEFSLSYPLLPKVTQLSKELGFLIQSIDYLEEVSLKLLIEPVLYDKFMQEMAELTAGAFSHESIRKRAKHIFYNEQKKN